MAIWAFSQTLSYLIHAYPEILASIVAFSLLLALRHANRAIIVNWPMIGMLPSLITNMHRYYDYCTDILRDSGSTFLFMGPSMKLLWTADPANVNHIYNANFPNYPKGDDYAEIFEILGDGIFNADSESWRRQRRMAQSFMMHQRFQTFVVEYNQHKVEDGLIPLLGRAAESKQVIDLQDIFLRFTFDTTCNMVFGVDPGCLSHSFPTIPFAKAMDDAMKALFFRYTVPRLWWKMLRRLRIGEEKKLAKAWVTIDAFIAQSITKKRENMARTEVATHNDLLTSYMNSSEEISPDKFLRDTIVNLILAGRDTTGVSLAWFFWLVSKNPDVETKILDELNSNLPSIEQTDSGLVYLHAALCESLRLYPPVPQEHKGVLKPDILPSGHEVRPGIKILICAYVMGRMERVWGNDCLAFKPERWVSEKGKLKFEPSYKFFSFNSGPRTCLGKDMAFTQMKVAATAILQRFHIEPVDGHVVEPKLSIILHMKNGLKVRVRKREQ